MATAPKKLPRWEIAIIRKGSEVIGAVDAPDAEAAIKAAIEKSGTSPTLSGRSGWLRIGSARQKLASTSGVERRGGRSRPSPWSPDRLSEQGLLKSFCGSEELNQW